MQIIDDSSGLQCLDTSCEQQWLYTIGEEGVIYSEAQNCFAGLDAAGVLAYQAFDAGVAVDDLLDLHKAAGGNKATTETLHRIFMLSRGQFPASNTPQPPSWPALMDERIANLEIHGIPLKFEYPDKKPLKNLSRDCFRSCQFPGKSRPARHHLDVQPIGDRWAVCINNYEFFSLLRDEQIGLGFLHAVRSILYADAEYDVAFHAAMVADDRRGIMLCAPRESGKSTLAAYLVAKEFHLITDEPALLNLNTASISALEMPISLKEGSWKVLISEWPQLASAPIHVRSDTVKIRLLHPTRERATGKPARLSHIVFPRYSPTATAVLERLSPIHALELLNTGGILLGTHVRQKAFEYLLTLIGKIPAYTLNYRDLAEAHALINTTLK
jgi:hypothetical protein